MGKRTNVALVTGVAGLGFVMMGCPPAEEPPPGERIVEPAPRDQYPMDRTTPAPPPRDDTLPPPTDPPPMEPEPTDPDDPDPLEPDPYGPGR